jgi:hypothetical protein
MVCELSRSIIANSTRYLVEPLAFGGNRDKALPSYTSKKNGNITSPQRRDFANYLRENSGVKDYEAADS